MRLRAGIVIAAVAGATQLWAGGPLAVHQGRFVTWRAGAAINYWIDDGPLASIATPQTVIQDAFAAWAKVPTASLAFKPSAIGKNLRSHAEVNAALVGTGPLSSVLLDEDGSVFRSRFGARANRILAVTYPRSKGSELVRFDLLLNGARVTTKAELFHTAIHEAGHAIGLDHTQLNATAANNGNAADDGFLPVLFPHSSKDRAPTGALAADDAAAVSALYQNAAFQKTYGRITGTLLRANAPVKGANLVAIRLTPDPSGTAHDRAGVFSCVSDYLKGHTGAFDLYVPQGRYQLRVEPLRFEFVESSSVGPYAAHLRDFSFSSRVSAQTLTAIHTVSPGQTVNVGPIHVK